jgi:putative hemolysin
MTWLQLAIIVLLTIGNGFFAASEIAIVSARRGRLQQRAEAGSTGAREALMLADDPNRFLATVQVGITVIGTFAAAFGGDALSEPLAELLAPLVGQTAAPSVALGLVVVLISYLSLILGELVPKRLALQHAEAMAVFMAPIMRRVSRLAAPVVWFLTVSTQAVLRLLGRANQVEEPITEEDVLSLVREGAEGGTVAPVEQEMIERVFDFTDAMVRAIMTPRTAIVAVDVETPLAEAIRLIVDSGYSRLPVYRGTIDTIEGIVVAKDLLRETQRQDSQNPASLQELIRPPVFVLEHQRIGAVLQHLKQERTRLALVLDEYGQVDGLVTADDILEELTGDIPDEYDEVEAQIVRRPDGSFLVDGLMAYADAESRIGLPPREQLQDLPAFETMAGLALALLGHIPTAGETATIEGWILEVVDMDGVRIDKLLVRREPQPNDRAQTEGSLAIGAVLPPPEH